jgi:hypothetical protein
MSPSSSDRLNLAGMILDVLFYLVNLVIRFHLSVSCITESRIILKSFADYDVA